MKECGVHGRFEYCIDDFSGCVIGCHCYPGYYFDTDSKICEPNTKLTQDYRRHMIPSAYNLHGSSGALIPPVVPVPSPPEVTAAPDDPGQDNGDLSDWLYNQFFKTIESQVVNKTDDEPIKAETRRSGAPIEPFIARRHSRRRKSRKRLRKKKDDNESEKESSSDSSSESESGDSRGDLGSWERFEFGPRPSQTAPSDSNKDGSHRQIVMYSKKPKPPLPSFIFLPNMGTMFYPPIGLPAPPIPMYPMVPIPPIHPGQPDHDENEKTTIATSSHEPTTSVASTTTTATTAAATTTSPPSEANTDKPTQENILRNHKMQNRFIPRTRMKPQPRHVFKPSPHPPPMNNPIKHHQDSDYDAMFMGDNSLLLDQGGPDFKYISELIHRENNDSTTQPPMIKNPKRYENFLGMKPPMPHANNKRQPITPGRLDSTRRRFDPRNNGEDDSYYSSLGKQIAKLIRGLDSADVMGADIKIEPAEDPKPAHPFFSESSYAARTYWERFVRSPLSLRLQNFTKYEDLIASNENLFELENQVQEATSAPVLSWLELENLISTMGAIRNQVRNRSPKNNNDKLSNTSLNISLLPKFSATRSLVSQKPESKTNDNTLFATLHDVIGKLTRSDRKPIIANQEIKNKIKELHEHPKIVKSKSLVNNQPKSIYLSTNIYKPHRSMSTLKPKLSTSLIKDTKHGIKREKVDHRKIDYFNEIVNKPHMITIDGKTAFVKTKKYFFDSFINYQFGNWVID